VPQPERYSKLSEAELVDMAAPWELLMIGSLLATPAGLATETDTSGEA